MKKTYIAVCACCLVGFWSCGSSGNGSNNGDVTVIPFTSKTPEPLVADRYFSDIEFVPLETNENSLMGDVQRMEFVDSLVFLCSDNQLFVFNDKGKFISQIGRKGRGHGEYLGFRGFWVDPDGQTVNIIDPTAPAVLVYSFDGRYLRSDEIPDGPYDWGYFAMPAGDNEVLIFNSHNPEHNMAYTLMNSDDKSESKHFCTYDPVKIEKYTYHFATHPMTRSGGRIHFTMPLDPLIYEYADGDVLPKYRVETPPKIISQEMMSEQLSEDTYFMSLVKLTRSDYFGGFTDIFETGDYIFLHYVANMAYPGLYVLDKNRLTGSYFTYPSGGKEFTSPMFPFSASDGNRIVSVVPFRDFMALKDLLSNNEIEQGKWSAELQGVLNGMNDQSNPLLVFYNVSAN